MYQVKCDDFFLRAPKRLYPAGAGSCRKSCIHGRKSSAARWGPSHQNAAADLFPARSALHGEVFQGTFKCKAHKQRLLGLLTRLHTPVRGACPTGGAFLGKEGTKVHKHHLERPGEVAGAKPCRKAVGQGQVSELYPLYRHNPTHKSPMLSCSNAAAKAAVPFHGASGFSNLFVTQVCSEGVYFFLQRANFLLQPPSDSTLSLHESQRHNTQGRGKKRREVRYRSSQ